MRRKGFFGLAAGLCFLIFVLTVFIGVPRTNAATPVNIEAAIVKGLAWLDTQQLGDGHWRFNLGYDDNYVDVATTAMVVLKFEERAKELGLDPFDATQYEYADNVIKGLDYIFSSATSDALGVRFVPGNYTETYTTGIVMMAVAASNAPARVVGTGILATQTYLQALQGMMNWMAYAQGQTGCQEGGWPYYQGQGAWADNSISGYASTGLGFAAAAAPNGFGLTIPPAVLTKLNTFINNIQWSGAPYDGGSDYNTCYDYSWTNILKTGNLLYELAIAGAPLTDTRVQRALAYIDNFWNAGACNDCQGGGWKYDYQAMFTLMKGLDAYGIEKISGGTIDWFDEVSTYIVDHQNPDGSWIDPVYHDGYSYVMNTAWALLTLEKAVAPVVVSRKLTALSPAEVWVGLTNSDDVGLYFDILAEVLVDDHSGGGPQVVASEQVTRVWGGSSGFNNAVKSTIPFNLPNPVAFPAGSTLSLRVSVRQACTAPRERYCIHVNECKARLWYNDKQARSGFDATIDGVNTHYFLQSNFVLGTSWGPGPKKTSDKGVGSRCSPFKSFGTWSIVPQ